MLATGIGVEEAFANLSLFANPGDVSSLHTTDKDDQTYPVSHDSLGVYRL